jgi:CheY-like chemotaxis protein
MTEFSGLRILVVEDEAMIAMLIEDMLEELGHRVIASVASLAVARDMAARAELDLAVLDVNVAGELIFPVANVLQERDIPFLFSTGYGAAGLSAEFLGCEVLTKPFSQPELREKIIRAFNC